MYESNPVVNLIVFISTIIEAVAAGIAIYQTLFKPTSQQKTLPPQNEHFNPYKVSYHCKLCLAMSVLVTFLVVMLYHELIVPTKITDEPTFPNSPPSVSLPPISSTPVPTPLATPTTIQQSLKYLCDLKLRYESKGNFFFDGWLDKTGFYVGERELAYENSIGMCIYGTKDEQPISTENTEDNEFHPDGKEVYIEYSLECKYTRMEFSIGAAKKSKAAYNSSDTNSRAQVEFLDVNNDIVLYKSGWEDYNFTAYNLVINNLSNVDILRITFRSRGEGKDVPVNRLRLVLIEPKLYSPVS